MPTFLNFSLTFGQIHKFYIPPIVMTKRIVFTVGCWLILPFCLYGQSVISSDDFQPIDQTIKQWIEEEKIPSMAVAVARHGEIIWMDAFGLADREQKRKASPQTIYALGSLAKSMAATGMMTLVERDLVHMDASVNALIAPARIHNYHGEGKMIKVRHILNMSAGIPHGWVTYPDSIFEPLSETQKNEFSHIVGLSTFPPGEVQHYSNHSYWFLDLMMERVSGLPLGPFMQTSVFQPLQMTNSYTQFERSRANDFAMPYHGSLEPVGSYHFLPYGGGGYYSTAEDLIKYGLFFLKQPLSSQQEILSHATIDLMHKYDQGAKGMFQLGWFNAGNAIISNGNITGANSMILLVPEEEIAIVCLTNTHENSYADQLAFMMLNHLVPGFDMGMNPETYAQTYEAPYLEDERLLGVWEGSIHVQDSALGFRMQFQPAGQVQIQIGREQTQIVEAPIFNFLDKFEGRFSAHIPLPKKEGTDANTCMLTLHLDGERLYGHVRSKYSQEDGSAFSFGAYVELKKQ